MQIMIGQSSLGVCKNNVARSSLDNTARLFADARVDEILITKVVKPNAKMYVKSDSRIEASREDAPPPVCKT